MERFEVATEDINEDNLEIPEWHKAVVRERLELYKGNPDQAQDTDSALDEIEREYFVRP